VGRDGIKTQGVPRAISVGTFAHITKFKGTPLTNDRYHFRRGESNGTLEILIRTSCKSVEILFLEICFGNMSKYHWNNLTVRVSLPFKCIISIKHHNFLQKVSRLIRMWHDLWSRLYKPSIASAGLSCFRSACRVEILKVFKQENTYQLWPTQHPIN